MGTPVQLDFSKAVPVGKDEGVQLDFSKAVHVDESGNPISPAQYIGPYDPSNRTPNGEPLAGDRRNAFQRHLDLLATPDPRREEWQSAPKTAADRFSQGVQENVIPLISHPLSSIGGFIKQIGSAAANAPDIPGGFAAEMVRPIVEGAINDYQQNGPQKAIPHILGQGAGMLATGELGGEVTKPIIGKITKAVEARQVANIGKAHEAVLADVGGDYVPRTQSDVTRPLIRNQAAAHPELVKVINGKDPQAAYAAHVKILDDEIKDIDAYHDSVRQPVENYPVEPADVIHEFYPSSSKFNAMPEAQQAQLNALAGRINKARTLEDLNNLRIQLNEEDLGARSMQTEPSPGYKSSLHSATNAVRDAYYTELEKATGKDFRGLKRTEGALKEEVYNAKQAQAGLAQKEVKANTPTGRERAANLVAGAKYPSGVQLPIISSVANALRGTDLANLQSHLQTLYSGLPEYAPTSVPGGMPAPRGLLPEQASPPSGQLALPASTIPNADEFGAVDAGRIPGGGPGFHVKPEASAYPHEQVIPGRPPAATGPTVPPRPAQFLQLPAEAGQGGSKFVSREQVGPQPSPNQPPPVNPATAVERITPKAGGSINLPQSGSYRVIQARPNGEMVIQHTRQLAAPEVRSALPARASPSTVTPSSPQLPPVGYTFTGPDGIVRTVTKVGKDGTVLLKEVKSIAGALRAR